MPWGNGTGPSSLGPMTGRAMGFCAGYNTPGYVNPYFRAGPYGRGFIGRGRGFYGRGFRGIGYSGFGRRGGGRGRGFGRYYTYIHPGWGYGYAPYY